MINGELNWNNIWSKKEPITFNRLTSNEVCFTFMTRHGLEGMYAFKACYLNNLKANDTLLCLKGNRLSQPCCIICIFVKSSITHLLVLLDRTPSTVHQWQADYLVSLHTAWWWDIMRADTLHSSWVPWLRELASSVSTLCLASLLQNQEMKQWWSWGHNHEKIVGPIS